MNVTEEIMQTANGNSNDLLNKVRNLITMSKGLIYIIFSIGICNYV